MAKTVFCQCNQSYGFTHALFCIYIGLRIVFCQRCHSMCGVYCHVCTCFYICISTWVCILYLYVNLNLYLYTWAIVFVKDVTYALCLLQLMQSNFKAATKLQTSRTNNFKAGFGGFCKIFFFHRNRCWPETGCLQLKVAWNCTCMGQLKSDKKCSKKFEGKQTFSFLMSSWNQVWGEIDLRSFNEQLKLFCKRQADRRSKQREKLRTNTEFQTSF